MNSPQESTPQESAPKFTVSISEKDIEKGIAYVVHGLFYAFILTACFTVFDKGEAFRIIRSLVLIHVLTALACQITDFIAFLLKKCLIPLTGFGLLVIIFVKVADKYFPDSNWNYNITEKVSVVDLADVFIADIDKLWGMISS